MTEPRRLLSADAVALSSFVDYCRRFGPEHDDSFLPEERYSPAAEDLALVLVDAEGGVRGALLLPLGGAASPPGRRRISVLHSGGAGGADREGYRLLLRSAAAAAAGRATELYLFLPEGKAETIAWLEEAGFRRERTALAMRREGSAADPFPAAAGAELPPGYRIRSLRAGDEAGLSAFAAVRNRAFSRLPGASPMSAADWARLAASGSYLEAGIMLLEGPEGPCGTIAVELEEEAGAVSVGTVAVAEEARGGGLGRALLRAALALAAKAGRPRAYLSVDAGNEGAARLYLSEGFVTIRAMACLGARPELLADRLGRVPPQPPSAS